MAKEHEPRGGAEDLAKREAKSEAEFEDGMKGGGRARRAKGGSSYSAAHELDPPKMPTRWDQQREDWPRESLPPGKKTKHKDGGHAKGEEARGRADRPKRQMGGVGVGGMPTPGNVGGPPIRRPMIGGANPMAGGAGPVGGAPALGGPGAGMPVARPQVPAGIPGVTAKRGGRASNGGKSANE